MAHRPDFLTRNLQEDIFFLDLCLSAADGAALATNRYVFTRTENLAALMAPQPQTTLEVTITGADAYSITNTGAHTAFFVWLTACPEPSHRDARLHGSSGWAIFDDNYFCLLPGERRTVTVTWQDAPEDARNLAIKGWNTNLWIYSKSTTTKS